VGLVRDDGIPSRLGLDALAGGSEDVGKRLDGADDDLLPVSRALPSFSDLLPDSSSMRSTTPAVWENEKRAS
jgi:hypothetical protein